VKRIVIAGGTGFIGRRLAARLTARGDEVTVLTRDPSKTAGKLPEKVRAAAWNPSDPASFASEIEAADVVVNLSGEPVAQRWTEAVRKRIVESRADVTRAVVDAIGAAKHKPEVLVNASATGWYGPQAADVALDESAPRGEGFLADVVAGWEAEATKVTAHGVRGVQVRIGVVFGDDGGALEKMLPPFKAFVGGPVGNGKQIVSWIHRDDIVELLAFATTETRATGPINGTAPGACTQKELATAIGAALSRPSWLPVPAAAMELMMGEASSIITTGQRVVPQRALDLGFVFRFPDIGPALVDLLKK
jgi:hypothetical protein